MSCIASRRSPPAAAVYRSVTGRRSRSGSRRSGRSKRRSDEPRVKVANMSIGHTTPAGTSVLDELNLDRSFVVKSKLAIRIAKTVQELGLKQREAASRMG